MIVRITNRGNQHYGYYGVVYEMSTSHKKHMILLIADEEGRPCITNGSAGTNEFELDTWFAPNGVPHFISRLEKLAQDGHKFQTIQQLLNEDDTQ